MTHTAKQVKPFVVPVRDSIRTMSNGDLSYGATETVVFPWWMRYNAGRCAKHLSGLYAFGATMEEARAGLFAIVWELLTGDGSPAKRTSFDSIRMISIDGKVYAPEPTAGTP